jgi:hypothetical protein
LSDDAVRAKSVEPMAAISAAQYRPLLHFVGEGNWSDEKVLGLGRSVRSAEAG